MATQHPLNQELGSRLVVPPPCPLVVDRARMSQGISGPRFGHISTRHKIVLFRLHGSDALASAAFLFAVCCLLACDCLFYFRVYAFRGPYPG
eukprot:6642987-Pyramimonas_sp.AAC.1